MTCKLIYFWCVVILKKWIKTISIRKGVMCDFSVQLLPNIFILMATKHGWTSQRHITTLQTAQKLSWSYWSTLQCVKHGYGCIPLHWTVTSQHTTLISDVTVPLMMVSLICPRSPTGDISRQFGRQWPVLPAIVIRILFHSCAFPVHVGSLDKLYALNGMKP